MQGLFRLQDNTPEAYTEDSRDFQLMLRLLDCVNSGVGFYTDSITNTIDTKFCSASLLELLKTKLGFFSNVEFQERELRYILRGFPYIMRHKGSLLGIKEAVYAYMNAKGISCPHKTYVDRDKHKVFVYIESAVTDTTILDEIFKFIVPAGYSVEYAFYIPTEARNEYTYKGGGYLLDAPDNYNSVVRGSEDDGEYYGFIEAPYRKNGYEVEEGASLSYGVLYYVSFVASENAPHLYNPDTQKSYSAINGSWVEESGDSYSPYGILIGDGQSHGESVPGVPTNCSVDGTMNPTVSLYSNNKTWTNFTNEILGTVGSANVIGSSNTVVDPEITVDTF